MIVKPELVKKIRSFFNLNIYETKVWLALLAKGIASAGEIAEISGVPRSRTYDVLESLEKQGFAIAKIGKPVKYLAVKPMAIIEKLKNNTMKNASERVDILAKLKETKEYTELEDLYKTGIHPIRHEEMSSAIRGRANLYAHIREMIENAEKEVIICSTASEIENRSRVFFPVFERLNKEKINLKIALNSSDEDIRKVNEKYKIKAKKFNIKGRFFIIDGKQVLFMVSPETSDEEYDIGVWISSEFFSLALKQMFDSAWKV